MRLGVVTKFKANRKEPLGAALARIHDAFAAAGLGPVRFGFGFSDSPVSGGVSAVARAVKKRPELAPFETEAPPNPGMPDDGYRQKMLTDEAGANAGAPPLGYEAIRSLAEGVPRSLPFHAVAIAMTSPEFGEGIDLAPGLALAPGVQLSDAWWVNGRQRSLSALHVLEVDPRAAELPAPDPGVAQVLAACGAPAETTQVPIPDPDAPGGADLGGLVARWRDRVPELARAQPHDLPDAAAAREETPLGTAPGPMKPALVRAFKPLGYGVKGTTGTFTLTRRSAANTALALALDVGTWSRAVTASFEARARAGAARFLLPVAPRAVGAMQYPMGGPERWAAIVENLAHLVAALEREFLPEFEAAAGPTPAWYRP